MSRQVLLLVLVAIPSFAHAGWYLLAPPLSSYDEKAEYLKGYKLLTTQPLSKWTHRGAYDTAAECDDAKHNQVMLQQGFYSKSSADYVNAVGTNKSPAELKLMRQTADALNANVFALLGSRCIKSDDPRLAK